MPKKTSERGIKAIAIREGEVLHGYKDSKGLLTVGVGHLCLPGEPYKLHEPITKEESRRLLAIDLKNAENAVNSVKVPLSQNQFDALVSLTFNIGAGGFKRSSVVRRLNDKNYTSAAEAILMWNKPPEIRRRRHTEYDQFLTPYPESATTAPDTEAKQKPTGLTQTLVNTQENQTASLPIPEPTPTTQNADTIVNTGDNAAPLPPPMDVTIHAPQGMGSVSGATKVTIAGITVPPLLLAIVDAIKSWIHDGYIDARETGELVINLIRNNTKYILIGVGLVVVVIIVKKICREIIFLATVVSKMFPSLNSVTIVAPVPVVKPKSWWQFWKVKEVE